MCESSICTQRARSKFICGESRMEAVDEAKITVWEMHLPLEMGN
jgi:hypothetical protein